MPSSERMVKCSRLLKSMELTFRRGGVVLLEGDLQNHGGFVLCVSHSGDEDFVLVIILYSETPRKGHPSRTLIKAIPVGPLIKAIPDVRRPLSL